MKIICLDDHSAMLDSLVRDLKIISPHSSVYTFQDAETALECAEENGCDVLFTEIDLACGDGLVLAERMQTLNPRLNIIFATVCEESERAKEVFRLHPSSYLTKPYTREQIAAALNNLRFPVEESRGIPRRPVAGYPSRSYNASAYCSQQPSEFRSRPAAEFRPRQETEFRPSMSTRPVSRLRSEPDARFTPPYPAEDPRPAAEPVPQTADAAEAKPEAENAPRPMSDKELRRLSRTELLEMLIAQAKENDKLNQQIKELETKLEDKNLTIRNAGSIAQAAVEINGVLEAAQRAADQYLANVRGQSDRGFRSREPLSFDRSERAERLLADARARCAAMEDETARKCEEMLRDTEEEVQARWDELQEKMDSYLHQHEQLRTLFNMYR